MTIEIALPFADGVTRHDESKSSLCYRTAFSSSPALFGTPDSMGFGLEALKSDDRVSVTLPSHVWAQ
jgi:hypothetical protein